MDMPLHKLEPDIRRGKYLYHHFGYDIIMEFPEFWDKYKNTIQPTRCDCISFSRLIRNDIYCAPGACPHYGRCNPVIDIRDTPKDAQPNNIK